MAVEIPKLKGGTSLKLMIELQKILVAHYISIEGLPKYPIDINSKSGQKVIKDFIRRFIEELCEAFTELRDATIAMGENNQPLAREFIKHYNEEVADAMHFLLEMLIYMGIEHNEVEELMEAYFSQYPEKVNLYKVDSPIETLLILGGFYNQATGIKSLNQRPGCFRVYTMEETMEQPQLAGGSRVSNEALIEHGNMLWNVTYSANMVANALNNRDHHQTENKKVNEIVLKETILTFLLEVARYLTFSGITEQSLFNSYYLKNRLNHDRINDSY